MQDSLVPNVLHSLPRQIQVAAELARHPITDVTGEVAAQLNAVFSSVDLKGKRVAVTVGSRGIDRQHLVIAAAVATIKSRGGLPLIFPAMGSHGGATPEGQRTMLEANGVTEESAGAPIIDTMETVEVGRVSADTPVHIARPAFEADVVLIVNRIKPHTDFASETIGSGLRKMCVIGLGKANGSFAFHKAASKLGYEKMLLEISAAQIARLPLIFGLGLVEDGYHQLAHIEAMTGAQIPERETAMLQQARAWMPRLPFSQIDVLIIDEIGKNISGAGMDPNITGRSIYGTPRSDRSSDVGIIYARGLTEASHGNAIGLGFADVVSKRLVDQMDKESTYTNSLSSMTPVAVRIPMHYASDAECMQAAVRLAGTDAATAKIVRIKNTLALDQFITTETYAGEIAERNDLQILQPPERWQFTSEGNFADNQSAH
jgi:hypothetical protein